MSQQDMDFCRAGHHTSYGLKWQIKCTAFLMTDKFSAVAPTIIYRHFKQQAMPQWK